MANYVMKGYQTPAGITDSKGVRDMQRKLGVTTDGVWGPQTQKAYDRYMSSRMDGVSGSYYPQNENNARMRDVSPAYNQGGSQYKKVLGISDPAFSDGDQFVNYAEYLKNLSGETNKPASNRSVVEDTVRLRTGDKSSRDAQEPEWLGSVSAFLPSPYVKTVKYNPYPVGSDFIKNNPTPEDVERQIANSMGVFRQAAQISDENNKRRENEQKVLEVARNTVDKYGLDSGTMPVSQYGGHGSGITYPLGSTFPANSATPLEILAQRQQAQQFANSMGVFRQAAQISDEKNKRRENEQKVLEAGRNTVDKYGLDSGTMPVSQYGKQATGLNAGSQYDVYLVPSSLPINTSQYVMNNDSTSDYLKFLDDTGDISDYIGVFGKVLAGEFGDFLDGGGAALSTAVDIMEFGLTLEQDLHDEDKKIGLPTISAAAGIIGGVIGGAAGSIAGPVGAYAGGYLGAQLLTKLAEEMYNAKPVPLEEALERVEKYTSPLMPRNALSPHEILAQRQARIQ